MRRIAFRTMGSKYIGYGHLYRCLSLAKAIIKEAIDSHIIFIVNGEAAEIVRDHGFEYIESNVFNNDCEIIKDADFDLVIIDSYDASNSYLRSIKNLTKILLFDDNNDIYDSQIPDILLNGNIHAKDLDYKRNGSTCFLLGLEYLVMQEAYWNDSNANLGNKEGILITTGGSDIFNISVEILRELNKTDFIKKVVVGPGYSNKTINELSKLKDDNTSIIMKPNGLRKYIMNSEYVITASGSTVYEVLSQKSIPIIFSLADNQEKAYKYLKNIGIHTIGNYPDIKFNKIIPILKNKDKKDYREQFNLIDGKGALRVARVILSALKSSENS